MCIHVVLTPFYSISVAKPATCIDLAGTEPEASQKISSLVVLEDVLILFLFLVPPRGEGPRGRVRTAIGQRSSEVLGRFRPGSRGQCGFVVRISLLSVRVTGPPRKQVLVRRALLGRVLAELINKGKPQKRPPAGLRPAGGRV
jgi:hypothetical protein